MFPRHRLEISDVGTQLFLQTVDRFKNLGVLDKLSGLFDHADRLLSTIAHSLDVLLAGFNDEVLGVDARHQHVGLDSAFRVRLASQAAVLLEHRVGLDEAVHAEGRDAQEEQQDHAEADGDFDRDPGVRKEAHASASIYVSTVRV